MEARLVADEEKDHLKRLEEVSCKPGDCKCSPTPYFFPGEKMSQDIAKGGLYWGDIDTGDVVKKHQEGFVVVRPLEEKLLLVFWKDGEEVVARKSLTKMANVL